MEYLKLKNVDITGGFWADKQRLNREVTAGAVYDRFSETGRFDSLDCLWKEGDDKHIKPHFFWDSDVAKWIEGISYLHSKSPEAELLEKAKKAVESIISNQWSDGYINSYYTVTETQDRFKKRNRHELYCIGHLIEAAIAYTEASGDRSFLDAVERCMELVEKIFIKEDSAPFKTPGHPEIELALVRLYRYTGKKKYLDAAEFFISKRGEDELPSANEYPIKKYGQDHLPTRKQTTAEGHSVRAAYLYTAMADLAFELGDKELGESCKAIFEDIVNRKMYITGGIGSSFLGETFTVPYDLPNEHAYAETCASIGMIYFCSRMLRLEHKSIYSDVVERELYNGALSGLSLDGDKFFYENPLEINLKKRSRNVCSIQQERFPITQRVKVFGCSCCPPNLVRLIASVGEYAYSVEDKTVWVEQFMNSNAELNGIKISQETNYPNESTVRIKIEGAEKLCIRIPSWCDSFEASVPYTVENGYAVIENPSSVEINLNMKPVLMGTNAEVADNVGKAAIQYGPFVYCVESVDNVENLHSLYIDKDVEWESEFKPEFNASILRLKGWRKISDNKLYSKYTEDLEPYTVTAIPYHAFANRGECDMAVWIRVK